MGGPYCAGDNTTFRFVGPEGVLTIGDNLVTLSKRRQSNEPGHTADTFAKATQAAFMKDYRSRYPDRPELQPRNDVTFAAPARYNSTDDHFRNFFGAVRTRQPVVEDAVFGLRAAWNAAKMTTTSIESHQ